MDAGIKRAVKCKNNLHNNVGLGAIKSTIHWSLVRFRAFSCKRRAYGVTGSTKTST